MTLKAPFPWFGGKSKLAATVWSYFGQPANYVEPFCGSLSVLLARPGETSGRIETVNDIDAGLTNFWRAIKADPEAVALWADWPVSELDLHARHNWLRSRLAGLQCQLLDDPDYYDPKAAGWWVWGVCAWLGGGWCSYKGSARPLPHLANGGRGIHRLGMSTETLREYFQALQHRLRRVRIIYGDWRRVLSPAVTTANGVTAVFLDPPYSADRARTYVHDNRELSREVREWAVANGDNPEFRIALCGFEGEHRMPESWQQVRTDLSGYGRRGHSRGKDNLARERIWFSPHCRCQLTLFQQTAESRPKISPVAISFINAGGEAERREITTERKTGAF